VGSCRCADELRLVQERRNLTEGLACFGDLTEGLAGFGDAVDMSALEAHFVSVVKSYSERQGIS